MVKAQEKETVTLAQGPGPRDPGHSSAGGALSRGPPRLRRGGGTAPPGAALGLGAAMQRAIGSHEELA